MSGTDTERPASMFVPGNSANACSAALQLFQVMVRMGAAPSLYTRSSDGGATYETCDDAHPMPTTITSAAAVFSVRAT